MFQSFLAVAIGGALGSVFRWFLGVRLNGLYPISLSARLQRTSLLAISLTLPSRFFARLPQIPPEWRLFVTTGLMGGLSTFSTFSAAVVSKLQQGRLGWAAGEVPFHLSGSIIMMILGFATVAAVSRAAFA